MSRAYWNYVAREAAMSAIANTTISVALATITSDGRTSIPAWGLKGIAIDFIPQTFFMVLASTLAITLLTRRRLCSGQLSRIRVRDSRLLVNIPTAAWKRALVLAVASTVVLSAACASVLMVLDVESIPRTGFVTMKAFYAGIVSLMLAPIIVKAALAEKRELPCDSRRGIV